MTSQIQHSKGSIKQSCHATLCTQDQIRQKEGTVFQTTKNKINEGDLLQRTFCTEGILS